MDRREIDDVESHRLRVIDARQAIAKGRAFVAAAFGRARERIHTTPRCAPRRDRRSRAAAAHIASRRSDRDRSPSGPRARRNARSSLICALSLVRMQSPRAPASAAPSVGVAGAPCGLFDQRRAFQRLARQVRDAGFELRAQTRAASRRTCPPRPRPCTRRSCFRRSVQTPRQRSFPTCVMAVSCQRGSPTMRHFRIAATTSWPSLKTSASTTRSSPTTRLIGYRPPSTSGWRFSITAVGKARGMRLNQPKLTGWERKICARRITQRRTTCSAALAGRLCRGSCQLPALARRSRRREAGSFPYSRDAYRFVRARSRTRTRTSPRRVISSRRTGVPRTASNQVLLEPSDDRI